MFGTYTKNTEKKLPWNDESRDSTGALLYNHVFDCNGIKCQTRVPTFGVVAFVEASFHSSKLSRNFRTERDISREKSELYLRTQNACIQSSYERAPTRSANISRSSSAPSS